MTDILSLLPEEIVIPGQPAFRAGQVFAWLSKGISSFEEMTNLPKALRESLAERFALTVPEAVRQQTSKDGTIKTLWRFADGQCVESVVMAYKHGNTVCVSTQAGCRMGCAFCASASAGLFRNLTPGEMLAQVLFAPGPRPSHVVLMGMGEPLDNFDAVLVFLKLLSHPKGFGMSLRHVSLSTCAPPGGIGRLMREDLPLTLSVSLHAPDDETRRALMPVAKSVPVSELMADCRRYFEKTGRRISYEYAMIDGVNDSDDHARLLIQNIRGGHINLIPLNPGGAGSFAPSSAARVKEFAGLLEAAGLNVTVRRRLGKDIDAACGQLRGRLYDTNQAQRKEGCK